jgi:hypothetical protein
MRDAKVVQLPHGRWVTTLREITNLVTADDMGIIHMSPMAFGKCLHAKHTFSR